MAFISEEKKFGTTVIFAEGNKNIYILIIFLLHSYIRVKKNMNVLKVYHTSFLLI